MPFSLLTICMYPTPYSSESVLEMSIQISCYHNILLYDTAHTHNIFFFMKHMTCSFCFSLHMLWGHVLGCSGGWLGRLRGKQVLQPRDRLSTIKGLAFLSFFYKYPAHFLLSVILIKNQWKICLLRMVLLRAPFISGGLSKNGDRVGARAAAAGRQTCGGIYTGALIQTTLES